MAEYNTHPTLFEYIIPGKYHARMKDLEDRGLISEENPQTAREITKDLALVTLTNFVVGGTIIIGFVGLAKLVQG